jgi:hypothetical protein
VRKALKLILILALFSFLISGCTKQSPTPSTQDTTPPQVSITSPQNGQTVSGTITIQASATDNVGVTKVEFYIDGNKVGEDTVSPYEYIWDTTQYANGNHTITAKAYDNAGNMGSASIIVNVQNIYQNVWQKTYCGSGEDRAYSIQQTTDGGYIVAGGTYSFGAGEEDVYVIKLDANGNKVWEKTFGGSDYDWAYSIQQTSDGGYIIAGWTGSFGAGENDVYIIKLDANGNLVWEKTYGGNVDDEAYSIQQTKDGGYIVAGYTDSFGAGWDDIYIIKLDVNGNKVWQKIYGGSNDDKAYSIQQTKDGGYIVAGGTNSFGAGKYNVYIIKLDANGNKVWEKTYGGSGYDWARSIQQTTDGGYIVAGGTLSFGAGGYNVYVIKMDSKGNTGPYPPIQGVSGTLKSMEKPFGSPFDKMFPHGFLKK